MNVKSFTVRKAAVVLAMALLHRYFCGFFHSRAEQGDGRGQVRRHHKIESTLEWADGNYVVIEGIKGDKKSVVAR
jgi:hypothetical protein